MRKHPTSSPQRQFRTKQNRWTFFNNGCVHGVHHSEVVIVKSRPRESLAVDSVGVFTISRPVVIIAALVLATVLAFFLSACSTPSAQKGGQARTSIVRPGRTNLATVTQPENPKEPTRQTVQSQQTVEYVLPPGTTLALGDPAAQPELAAGEANQRRNRHKQSASQPDVYDPISAAPSPVAVLGKPMPVRISASDRTETSIGAAQKDTAREWAARAASLQPVMWAGIAMMTIVAGVLIYFGWWTKAALAVVIGGAMIALAQTLPEHGTLILLSGLALFALAALLVLYAYYKGQLDQNHNGIPDALERFSKKDATPAAK
jgi:hypothetical protein